MASSDPLLTTLCSICHIEPPKYNCPRCGARTCSLACNRRHKAWSSCSGIRDATAYVPPKKLKTAAGVDHDFNFLTSIERAVQRSEKEIVEERGLLEPQDLRPIEVRSVQWRKGKDGRKRKVLVTEVLRNQGAAAGRPEMTKQMKKRLSTFGIYIRRVPFGMARQKENGTSLAKASGRINWQVEWLVLDKEQQLEASSSAKDTVDNSDKEEIEDGEEEEEEEEGNGDAAAAQSRKARSTRFLGKSFDHLPLYTAFANNHAAHLESLQDKASPPEDPETGDRSAQSKKRKQALPVPEAQDHSTATWPLSDYSLQPWPTSSWKRYAGTAAFTGLTQLEMAKRVANHYFLAPNPLSKTTDGRILVHPLDPLASLGEALRDTTVLEFPTIYVLDASAKLPEDLFEVTPKAPNFKASLSLKRKQQELPTRVKGKGAVPRGVKRPRRALEEGELPSDDDAVGEVPRGNRLGSDGEEGGNGGYEVVAEESLGEDDADDQDDDDDEDDTSSSSGSDSEADDVTLQQKLAALGRKR